MTKAPKLCSWDCEPAKDVVVFTQGNVNEVLPGVTRPLYADLAAEWDYRSLVRFTEDLGIRDLVDLAPPPRFNQLGFMGGRWTVNISFILAMTAVYQVGEGSAMLTQFFEGDDAVKSGAGEDARRAAAAAKKALEFWSNTGKLYRANNRESRASYNASRTRRLNTLADQQLVDLVTANTDRMGRLFANHIHVTVGGGDFSARLAGMIKKHIKKPRPEWVTTLTSAVQDVESTLPGKEIWDISRRIARHKSLAAEFATLSTERILSRLAAPPDDDWLDLAEAWWSFIHEYGWRGWCESDPSQPTWDEAPAFVIGALRAARAAPASADPYRREAKAAAVRERLEERILMKLPPGERRAFRRHLELTQNLSRNREGMKASWVRVSRNYRAPIMEFGRRLAAVGMIESQEDVWFLRWAELQEAARGELKAKAAKRAIDTRKAEYARLQDFVMPDGVFTWPAALVAVATAAASSEREFTALGVSPGVAEGNARVILTASDEALIEPGEVLIAPFTDAPWTPLFIPAAAVVVEVGGLLSHAAIVAREFGVPAVSGMKDATRIIKTGERVRVDGNTGTVTLLSR